MGRRSAHTAEELRELIIQAATELIQESGFGGLSAREIARRISYSPGTLYNVFEDLDDLVLTIEGRLLDKLTQALSDVPAGADPSDKVRRLAEVYVEFTRENPKLWNLLFEHHLPAGREVPAWYREKLEGLMSKVEDALQPLARDVDPETVRRSAKTLWAGVHGITSLSTADKLQIISTDSAGALLDDLVNTHLAGLEAMRHRQAETSP
jgi:AcrR family transcriptional regulator